MHKDFKMIVMKFPREQEYINIYPIVDTHIGSAEFDEKKFNEWKKIVLDDSAGCIVIAGDMLNNGIKNSKTNCYEEVMRPSQQKDYLYEAMRGVADRIICATGGNHEYRNVKEVDSDPLYDVMCRWNIGHLYRQNACYVKLALGIGRTNKTRQTAYGIVVTHGTSKNKHDKWANGVDGADLFISGHIHEADYAPKGKIRIDMNNECVSVIPYRRIVCQPFQSYGGYAQRGEYLPSVIDEFQVVRLDGLQKKINFFTV